MLVAGATVERSEAPGEIATLEAVIPQKRIYRSYIYAILIYRRLVLRLIGITFLITNRIRAEVGRNISTTRAGEANILRFNYLYAETRIVTNSV